MHHCCVVYSSLLSLCRERRYVVAGDGAVEGDEWWWLVGEKLEVRGGREIMKWKGIELGLFLTLGQTKNRGLNDVVLFKPRT